MGLPPATYYQCRGQREVHAAQRRKAGVMIPPRGRDLQEVARERDLLLVATDPDPNRARKIADDLLCLRLLAGLTQLDRDLVHVPFPDPGSDTEQRCRAALARVVRNYVPGNTGDLL